MRSGDEHDKRAERQRHATAAKEWAAAARKRANEAKERLLEIRRHQAKRHSEP